MRFIYRVSSSLCAPADDSALLFPQDVALQARDIPNQTFGVHSWTHGYSSSQTNEELLGELGWTMQGALQSCRTSLA